MSGATASRQTLKKTATPQASSRLAAPSGLLQRESAVGEPRIVHEVLRSPGQPLDAAARAFVEPPLGHDFGRMRVHPPVPPTVQTLLSISQPDDQYEQEANRMAEQVLTGRHSESATAPLSSASAFSAVYRLSADNSPAFEDAVVLTDQEQQGTPAIQSLTKRASNEMTGAAAGPSPSWEKRLDASRHGGKPLPLEMRQDMGEHFHRDFSGVRVHTDAVANQLSAAINARAFTHRSHIYFASGEYHPESDSGRRVLAHELTHVVQQGAAGPEPAMPASSPSPTSVQRLAQINSTTPANSSRINVAPWGPPDPRGNDYKVNTNAGNTVQGWVAYGGYPEEQRYWCHGFSLGTYAQSGYSVYSGNNMQTVIQDEWTSITPVNAAAGDIAVWLPNYQHSAIFTTVVTAGNGIYELPTIMDSKDGMNPLLRGASLSGLVGTYGPTYGVFRRK